jgi:hypothetical protein
MMSNIYDKLSKASQSADKVIKAPRKGGMPFNALLHDEVQKVAMKALHEFKLYPVCNYENIISDKNVFVKCEMTIHDTETKEQIVIQGCSAFGETDKYGTGKAMSYSRKYAFLNALNLETGLDNEDGYNPKTKVTIKSPAPIKQNTKSTNTAATDWINQMQSVAKHSKSQLYFEKNLTPIREEYKDDLHLIATDPIEQLRVDTEYNKLKSQIQTRGTNGR